MICSRQMENSLWLVGMDDLILLRWQYSMVMSCADIEPANAAILCSGQVELLGSWLIRCWCEQILAQGHILHIKHHTRKG